MTTMPTTAIFCTDPLHFDKYIRRRSTTNCAKRRHTAPLDRHTSSRHARQDSSATTCRAHPVRLQRAAAASCASCRGSPADTAPCITRTFHGTLASRLDYENALCTSSSWSPHPSIQPYSQPAIQPAIHPLFRSLDVLDHCTFENKFALFIFLLLIVRFVLSALQWHVLAALQNGTELTYFHPTWVLHFRQKMSRTTWSPVVICRSIGSPSVTLTLRSPIIVSWHTGEGDNCRTWDASDVHDLE
jgi:hypothetical protein